MEIAIRRMREAAAAQQSVQADRFKGCSACPHGPLPCIIRSLPNTHIANFFGKFFTRKPGYLWDSTGCIIHEQSKSKALVLAGTVTKNQFIDNSPIQAIRPISVAVSTVDSKK